MIMRRTAIFLGLLLLGACAPKPVPSYRITDVIPAGSRLEFFGQIHDDSWQSTLKMQAIPKPMPVKEAHTWALSAAQQRLGNRWKDYCVRVVPPEGKPVVVWQRHHQIQF